MEKLMWDSDFWGINIYHLKNIEYLDLYQLTDRRYLIQALSNVSDVNFIHKLENRGFKFQESKVTFIKQNFSNTVIDNSNIRELSLSDLMKYEYYFFELYGQNSRYSVFPKEKINKFYYTWLINSINGKMDDSCLGYFIDNQLAGFITYKIKGNFVYVGLLGVFPRYRGHGISQILLNFLDEIAINTSCEGIKVSTQGKNIMAINAYIKHGYRISSIEHWYYLIKGDLK